MSNQDDHASLSRRKKLSLKVKAYVSALILGLLSIYAGLYQTTDPSVKTLLSVVLPILILLVTDKITTTLTASDQLDELRSELRRSVPSIDIFTTFDGSREAFEYLVAAIPLCRRILNTRLTARPGGEPGIEDSQSQFDKAIRKAVQNGTHYAVVVSEGYGSQDESFRQFVHDKKPKGQYRGTIVNHGRCPYINFIVLERESYAEVLIGWAVAANWDHTRPVFLIRDRRVVEFFSQLHDRLLDVRRE